MTIGVLIADDQALVRRGFRMILEIEPDLEVLGEAADGREAVRLVHRENPDIAVMDIGMPQFNGLNAALELAHSHPQVRLRNTASMGSRYGSGRCCNSSPKAIPPRTSPHSLASAGKRSSRSARSSCASSISTIRRDSCATPSGAV